MINNYVQIDKTNNQMTGIPKKLPERWTTPEGATINGFNHLSDPVLYQLGWVPIVYEEITDSELYVHGLPLYKQDQRCFIYPHQARDIKLLKKESYKKIDHCAGSACEKYISTGVGQGMRYLEKSAEAKEFKALTNAGQTPAPEYFPLLKAEADAVSETYLERAELIIEKADLWQNIASRIEAARIAGKKNVRNALTNEEVVTARDKALEIMETL